MLVLTSYSISKDEPEFVALGRGHLPDCPTAKHGPIADLCCNCGYEDASMAATDRIRREILEAGPDSDTARRYKAAWKEEEV